MRNMTPGRFRQWKARGVTDRILAEQREQIRLTEGRELEPSARVIDSQSVKGVDTVDTARRGQLSGVVSYAG
jgi:putative transposase